MNRTWWYFILLFRYFVLLWTGIDGKSSRSKKHLNFELKTIVIATKSRPVELQEIESELKKFNISYELIKSIEFTHDPLAPTKLITQPDSKNFHEQTRMDLRLAEHVLKRRRDLNWEKVSRWQTHLQLYLDISYGERLTELGPFLILEDIAMISAKTASLLNPTFLLDSLPEDWDIFIVDDFLHNCFEDPKHAGKPKTMAVPLSDGKKLTICQVKSAYGIHGYIIRNTDAAVRLVHALNTKIPQANDVSLSRLFENQKLIAYTSVDRLVNPKDDRVVAHAI